MADDVGEMGVAEFALGVSEQLVFVEFGFAVEGDDADVGVVGLGENPAVAPWDGEEVEAHVLVGGERGFAFQCEGLLDHGFGVDKAADGAFGAVGGDEP